jgi:Cu(I)/Ag(I) efflux system membrane fusion protein
VTRIALLALVLAATAAAGSGGYWIGRHGPGPSGPAATAPAGPADGAAAPAASGPVIYYQDPDGKPDYSPEPKLTPDGRSYRAVHEGEEFSFDDAGKPQEPASNQPAGSRKILYYRNPMGLPDVSNTPKKDSMGMDYVPVYEGDGDDDATVRLSPGKVQRIGVSSEPAAMRVIAEPVRAPGTIELDERRIVVIALRTEAFIEAVEDVTSGSEVRIGQRLARIYSPAIAGAAAEYAQALTSRNDASARGTRQRLLNLGAPAQLLADIERTRDVPLAFILTAPRDGAVLERNAVDGQRVAAGDVLFRIADHSAVWAMVDVAERDLAAVAKGQPAAVRVRSHPDRAFPGKVALVYPHLNTATRTVPVRIELPNADLLLKPGMYAAADIDTGGGAPVLAVPDSAVIDSGDRQVVIIDKGDGRFEPRAVRLGRRGAGHVEVRDGVTAGEAVVTAANFLIDAESNLRSALKSLTGKSLTDKSQTATGAAP